MTKEHGPVEKAPTSISGFDEITDGGLPRGRTSLIFGGPGTGKTLFGSEFVIRGAIEHGEPGAIITFEEPLHELAQNVAGFDFDLEELVDAGQVHVDYLGGARDDPEPAGGFTLDGLFARVRHAVDSVGAKRIVIDGTDTLFAQFQTDDTVRREVRRLCQTMKAMDLTVVVTAEEGTDGWTRHGIEEYVSDCVIRLDQASDPLVTARLLRVQKYRGSSHGMNQYPFLITENGLRIMPITSLGLAGDVPEDQVSTGIDDLDDMFEGGGYYRGSTVLVSGQAGTGKTSVAAHFVAAAARRGERAVMVSFEEPSAQVIRNMRSIGLDLAPFVDDGTLHIIGVRPTQTSLEGHLASLLAEIEDYGAQAVAIDPITNLEIVGGYHQVKGMVMRLVDQLKARGITTMVTTLTPGGGPSELTEVGISSLADTWLLLRNLEGGGEHTRALYVAKSRGMSHSNQVREFVLTGSGIRLLPVYLGPEGMLTGTARASAIARERAEDELNQITRDRLRRAIEHYRTAVEAHPDGSEPERVKELTELEIELARIEFELDIDAQTRQERAEARGVDGHGGDP